MNKTRITGSLRKIIVIHLITALFLLSAIPGISFSEKQEDYLAVPELIDLRSTFSDGAHSIDGLARLARSRGFKVLFINDHDHITLSYGLPPFRNILRYKKELPSIMTSGVERYLEEIKRVSNMYPDMIIIPGCEKLPQSYMNSSAIALKSREKI